MKLPRKTRSGISEILRYQKDLVLPPLLIRIKKRDEENIVNMMTQLELLMK